MKNTAGQTLLIVVIALAVVVSVALSVAGRSVTDITQTTKEEEALRSFSAAEAGIEQTLLNSTVTSGSFGNSSFTSTTATLAQGSKTYVYPRDLASGQVATMWFMSHDATTGRLVCNASNPCFTGQTIRLCWGGPTDTADSTAPAIELSVVYDPDFNANFSNVNVVRGTYDPYNTRKGENNFTLANGVTDCTVNGQKFKFSHTVDLAALGVPAAAYNAQNGLVFAHIRALYNTTAKPVAIDTGASSTLPSQGNVVSSTGKSGDSNRKVEVATLFPDAPMVFDAAIYSPSSIIK